MLTSHQWAYIRQWVTLVIVAECIMLIYNRHLPTAYMIIAALFLGGFIPRIAHLYPGKPEPLILDLSAVLIALLFAYASNKLGMSSMRFLLILVSSLIIMPHIIYIIQKTDILR